MFSILYIMLPKQLKYGSKVESASAKSSRVNIAPQNGSGPYNLGDTLIFNIPTRQNLVLVPSESYLKFSLGAIKASAATALRWDSDGSHGLVQRIRIYHGSNLIQDIDNYGLLTKMLFDIQVPGDATYGKLNVMAGTRSDLVLTTPPAVTVAAANFTDNTVANIVVGVNAGLAKLAAIPSSAQQINSGALLLKNDGSTTLTAANDLTYAPGGINSNVYCLNLNCILGTLCSQNYFPLFACTSAPLRMEITLVDNLIKALNTVTAVTADTGIMTNVEYVANFIELGDSAMQMVAGSLQGQPLQFVVPDWRNYQFSYALAPSSVTQVSMAIPAKFSSLKSLFVSCRDKGTGALQYFPFSSVTNGMTDYQFRIGSSIFPPKAPNTYPEMFSELIKAIGSMSDLQYQPSIDKTSYTMASSVVNSVALEAVGASNASSGSFYIGIDLENYINANKDNIFAGWNSNTDDIFAIMNFNNAIASVVNVRFDAFSNYDSCICFENGTCFVRY